MEKVANPRRDEDVDGNNYSKRPIECIGLKLMFPLAFDEDFNIFSFI